MSLLRTLFISVCCILLITSFALADQKIVFASDQGGDWDIYTCDSEGQNVMQLTNDVAIDGYPRLNSNINKIAFISDRSGSFQLWVMNIDGSSLQQVTTLGTGGGQNPWGCTAWSPDGMQLLYNHGNELRRINIDGTGDTLIVTGPLGQSGIAMLDWSSIGNKIVFQDQGSWGYDNQIYIANPDGSDITLLVSDRPGSEGNPRFSPDGQQIAFNYDPSEHEEGSGRTLDSRIYIINLDGSNEHEISQNKPDSTNDIRPTWSPDGTQILFINFSNQPGSQTQHLWKMDISGNNRNQISTDNILIADWRSTPAHWCDTFDDPDLGNWILWGSPVPQWVTSVHGRNGIFDNNGDASYNSGATSEQLFDLNHGFSIEADVYLDFYNPDGCYLEAKIGISDTIYQAWGGYDGLIAMDFFSLGHGCSGYPTELRGHAYWVTSYPSECGVELFGFPDGSMPVVVADDYANGWHTMRIIVDSTTWLPSFYVDDILIHVGTAPVASSVMNTNWPLHLGARSSGSAGKAYHDNICFDEGGHSSVLPQPRELIVTTDSQNAYLNWKPALTCGELDIAYVVYFETDVESEFEFLAYTTDTSYTHEYVVQFASVMFYQVGSYLIPPVFLQEIVAELGGHPTRRELEMRLQFLKD